MNAVQCSEDDMSRTSSPMLTFRCCAKSTRTEARRCKTRDSHHLPQAREKACMCRLLDGDLQACQTT